MPISAALPAPQQRQNLAGQLFGPNVGGFVGGLGMNPLFMGGLTTLMGQGPTAGAQIAQATQQGQMRQSEFDRQQQQRQRMQEIWGSAFPGGQPNMEHPLLRGLPPELASVVAALGPEQGVPFLGKYTLSSAEMRQRLDNELAVLRERSRLEAERRAKVGLNPIYGVDEHGNPVVLQTTETGEVIRSQMPEGVRISREPIRMDAGTHWVLVDPITRQQIGTVPKATEEEASRRARGQELGKAEGAAMAGYEDSVSKAQLALSTIQKIKDHPARERMTGWSSYLPTVTPSGRGFQALLGQLEGQVFLEAYSGLRGGGHITEIEGEKAQRALARLDTAQSEEEFVQALDDLASVIRAGMQRAAKKAGVSTPQTEQRATRYRYNPATGDLEPAQ